VCKRGCKQGKKVGGRYLCVEFGLASASICCSIWSPPKDVSDLRSGGVLGATRVFFLALLDMLNRSLIVRWNFGEVRV